MARWVLLDLDGTLTDPKPGITGCISYALTELGQVSPPPDELTWCIGPPLRGSFCELIGEERADEALAKYRERFSEVGLFENEIYPEILEALEAMKGQGYRLALATSKPLVYADRIVEHFGMRGMFDSLYGSELDGTRQNVVLFFRDLSAKAASRLTRVEPDGIRNGAQDVFWGRFDSFFFGPTVV